MVEDGWIENARFTAPACWSSPNCLGKLLHNKEPPALDLAPTPIGKRVLRLRQQDTSHQSGSTDESEATRLPRPSSDLTELAGLANDSTSHATPLDISSWLFKTVVIPFYQRLSGPRQA
jgi:hypothetical protein